MDPADNDKRFGSRRLISEMDEGERPREKALRRGIKSLDDAELMALIFSTGIKGVSVVTLCEQILSQYKGHLSKIASMDAAEFMARHKGIGPAKALTLMAALELGARASADAVKISETAMSSSSAAYEYMRPMLADLDHEEFWILLLKRNLKPLREFRVGQGGLTQTVVDVRLIIREALLAKSSAMLLFHNHPSGNLRPSQPDIALTKRICDAAAYFDIKVLDHIVAGPGSYFSFNDEGLMPNTSLK